MAAVAACTSVAVDSAAAAWGSAGSAAAVLESAGSVAPVLGSAVLDLVLEFAQGLSAALGVPDGALLDALDGALPDVLDGALPDVPDGALLEAPDGVLLVGPSPVDPDGGVPAGALVGAVGAGAGRSQPQQSASV